MKYQAMYFKYGLLRFSMESYTRYLCF